jgi:hypothetical protein
VRERKLLTQTTTATAGPTTTTARANILPELLLRIAAPQQGNQRQLQPQQQEQEQDRGQGPQRQQQKHESSEELLQQQHQEEQKSSATSSADTDSLARNAWFQNWARAQQNKPVVNRHQQERNDGEPRQEEKMRQNADGPMREGQRGQPKKPPAVHSEEDDYSGVEHGHEHDVGAERNLEQERDIGLAQTIAQIPEQAM